MNNTFVENQYPLLHEFLEELRGLRDRFIVPQIEGMIRDFGTGYLEFAESLLRLSKKINGNPVDSILEYTVVFLKEQAIFRQTGNYSNADFETVYKNVYDNPDVMEAFYLEGLFLTQICWRIHYRIHRFFQQEFLPTCQRAREGLEVGFGHGLYLYELLDHADVNKVNGLDISEYSVRFADRLLKTKFSAERFSLGKGDVQQGIDIAGETMHWGILAEVLEHIHNPDKGILEMNRCLVKGAPLWVVTPMNSNALDHITNFESTDQIEALIVQGGFEIDRCQVFRITDDLPESTDITETYCAVCRKK